jgi:tetratricopeptide (TPR) repeat protein
METFRKVISLDPDDPMGYYYLAKILVELKRYGEAETALKKSLAIKPSFEPTVIDLGFLYQKQKKNALAIDLYRNFITLYPATIKVRIRLGDVLLKEKRFDEADRELKAILIQNPVNQELLLTIGVMYLEADRLGQAIALFSNYLKTHPEDQKVRFFLASAYEERKLSGHALDAFKMIPPDSEFYINAQIHVGTILKKEKKIDEAIKTLILAISQKRQLGDYLYILLATLYEDNKNISESEKVLKEGLSVSPKSLDILYSLGVLYEKTDRFEEGIRQMKLILELDPDHADSLNFIGYSYAERGIHLREAEEMIKKALTLKPGNAYIIDSLGWVYFKQNKIDQAIKYLKEATSLMPDDAAITEHLGDVYVQTGRFREALDIYKRSLQLNPDKETLQKKISDLLKKNNP